MTEDVNKRLIQFLNDGGNWERKATNIPGAFLLDSLLPKEDLHL